MARSPSKIASVDSPDRPAWFDPKRHRVTDYGVVETATNIALDEEGQPRSPASAAAIVAERARLAAEAAEANPAAEAAASETPAQEGPDAA